MVKFQGQLKIIGKKCIIFVGQLWQDTLVMKTYYTIGFEKQSFAILELLMLHNHYYINNLLMSVRIRFHIITDF